MHVIASTSGNRKMPKAKIGMIVGGILSLGAGLVGVAIYKQELFGFFLLIGAGLLIMSEAAFKHPYLLAYVDNQLLHFEFEDNRTENKHMVRLQLPLTSIRSYKFHSFLKKEPELLQISFLTGDLLLETRTIPIFYLKPEQRKQLIYFLDQLLVKIKRLH